ncbi:MAG TPA: zinc-dependent alcohol dehydrogenase family protein [Dissulfurispiraceae bacterium]|nr:zinc-dependent alcohol dehydrogenase family protein [Dissulfurispiraceae bacterium]
MKAMIINKICNLNEDKAPLQLAEMPAPVPGNLDVLVKVSACGVCHTELDEIEGRTPPSRLPIVPGHQVVGTISDKGKDVSLFSIGDRVGIAWINSSCGKCRFCLDNNENLCPAFSATGRDANGGYAEYMIVQEDFAYAIPEIFSDAEAAPLLCAGAVGYRSLRLSALINGDNLGLTGFGASAHLVLAVVRHSFPDSRIFVFSRTEAERKFALELGASWAGDFGDAPPDKLHCAIDTTPVWKPVVDTLAHLWPGGRLVINAIRKESIDKEYLLKLNYADHLWMEKEIKSVANVTRKDVDEFLKIAAEIPIRPEIQQYDLADANKALLELKQRKIRGAKVLRVG